MQELLTAVLARFKASALPGKYMPEAPLPPSPMEMWTLHAPHQKHLPMIILVPITPTGERVMSPAGYDQQEGCLLQFSIFVDHHQLEQGHAIAKDLMALYDNVGFTWVVGGVTFGTTDVQRVGPPVPVIDPDGGYGLHVNYQYKWNE